MCSGKGKKDSKQPEPNESTVDAFEPFESAVRLISQYLPLIYITLATKLIFSCLLWHRDHCTRMIMPQHLVRMSQPLIMPQDCCFKLRRIAEYHRLLVNYISLEDLVHPVLGIMIINSSSRMLSFVNKSVLLLQGFYTMYVRYVNMCDTMMSTSKCVILWCLFWIFCKFWSLCYC